MKSFTTTDSFREQLLSVCLISSEYCSKYHWNKCFYTGSVEQSPQIKLEEEKGDSQVPCFAPSSSSTTASSTACGSPARRASDPMPVVIKEEPRSPVGISSEMDVDNLSHFAHSTTPGMPFRDAGDGAHSLSGVNESMEKAVQSTSTCAAPDSKSPMKSLLLSRRGSETGSTVDCADTPSREPQSVPSAFSVPGSPSQLSGEKRVRKLKKRKVLKKAEGTEQPHSSDTEIEGEVTRRLRPRRRPPGGSQVSTSTQPTEGGEDVNTEGGEEPVRTLSPYVKLVNIIRSYDRTASNQPPLRLDSDETMDITAACRQHHTQAFLPAQAPNSSRPEPQSLACNEVTSTSDMDICRSSER